MENPSNSPRKAVFLDRDGTLNFDPGYLSEPHQMEILPGVGEALCRLQRAGFLLVVVSNQSGVGRGKIRKEAIPEIHQRMDELLAVYGSKIDAYELCFHTPEEACPCRKPKPALLLSGAKRLGIDLSRSFMVGDKRIDLEAGRAAGCQAVALVRTGYGAETEKTLEAGVADFIGDSLSEVVDWILAVRS